MTVPVHTEVITKNKGVKNMTEKEFLELFPKEVLEELKKADTAERMKAIAEKYNYKLPTLVNAKTALRNAEKEK